MTDASHELRMPITSLRTNLEHIQRSASIPEIKRQEILDDVLFELDELTGLVTELVELATDRHQMDDPSLVEPMTWLTLLSSGTSGEHLLRLNSQQNHAK